MNKTPKPSKKFKVRFAEDLGQHVVEVRNGSIVVHCVGWNDLIITPNEGEDVDTLRDRIFELIKGTPCGIADVQALLKLTL